MNDFLDRKLLSAVLVALGVQLLGGGSAGRAQEPVQDAAAEAESLEDFEILEYVATGTYPPGASIAMDNNARILFACREGRSAAELRASGVDVSDSQLEFLIVMNLLFRDGLGDLYTTFPILDPTVVAALRAETANLAKDLAETVQSDAEALARALEASGHAEHGYSILFSYVLDGMVWGFFEEYQKVTPRRLSARRPFWAGEVWAVRPGRETRGETRSISSKGLKLTMTSASNARSGDDFFANRELFKNAISETSMSFLVEEPLAREQLTRWSFLDESGRWKIPVIDEVKKDKVFRAAETLTSNLVDAILEKVDIAGFEARYGFRYPAQALVIVYHELMWDLIDRFEGMGVVTRPEGFVAPPAEAAASKRGTAFLVDRRFPKPDRQDDVMPARDAVDESSERADG